MPQLQQAQDSLPAERFSFWNLSTALGWVLFTTHINLFPRSSLPQQQIHFIKAVKKQ